MLLLVIGVLAIKGAVRGFFREAFGLLAVVAGVAAAIFLGESLAQQWRGTWLQDPLWARLAAHALLFVGPYVALQAVGLILNRLGRAILLGGADRVLGAAFGAVAGVVVTGAGLLAAQRSGLGGHWLEHSQLARPLAEVFSQVLELVRGVRT